MVTTLPEPHKRAYRYPTDKTAYHVQNWREYDKSWRDRGDITLWISQEAIDAWTPPHNGKRGAQPLYADIAIATARSLRLLFDLPLRQTEGFLRAILQRMGLELSCPDHTTLSRRHATVAIRQQGHRASPGPGDLHHRQYGVESLWSRGMAQPDNTVRSSASAGRSGLSGWITRAGSSHPVCPKAMSQIRPKCRSCLSQVDPPMHRFVGDGSG